MSDLIPYLQITDREPLGQEWYVWSQVKSRHASRLFITPMDVDHHVIGIASITYLPEQNRAPPRMPKRNGRRSMKRSG